MNIITLTLSPCIDKATSIRDLIPEKKLRGTEPVYEPGGGGINVARAIKKLGGTATAIYPSGGCTGQLFDSLLAAEEVPSVIIRTESETRENFIVYEESTGNQFRFGTPGTPLSEKEWMLCVDAVNSAEKPDYVIASGSMPPGVPLEVFGKLALIARQKGARFIVDTSGEALAYAINEGVFLVKPNLNELGALTGLPVGGTAQIAAAAQKIIVEKNCEVVVVSMGSAGAVMVTRNEVVKIPSPKIEIKSTVGAGDSMVAGIVTALIQGSALKEAVQYGVACGSAATINPGTELCRKEDADRLYEEIRKLPVPQS